MTIHLPEDSATQSADLEAILCVSMGGGSVALLATFDHASPGLVRVAGLRPKRHYLLAGATHRFAQANDVGEALVAVGPGEPALITLVPVI